MQIGFNCLSRHSCAPGDLMQIQIPRPIPGDRKGAGPPGVRRFNPSVSALRQRSRSPEALPLLEELPESCRVLGRCPDPCDPLFQRAHVGRDGQPQVVHVLGPDAAEGLPVQGGHLVREPEFPARTIPPPAREPRRAPPGLGDPWRFGRAAATPCRAGAAAGTGACRSRCRRLA